MMDTIKRCNLNSEHKLLDVAGLESWLSGSSLKFPAYAILERYSGIDFLCLKKREDLPSTWTESFMGRLFNDSMEFRWTGDGASFQAWTVQDTEVDHGDYEKFTRSYYLYGAWVNGRFFDPVVRRATLQYPVHRMPNGDDRSFIKAVLYRPARPDPWPDSLEDIRDRLNRPAIAAHRFIDIDFGRD